MCEMPKPVDHIVYRNSHISNRSCELRREIGTVSRAVRNATPFLLRGSRAFQCWYHRRHRWQSSPKNRPCTMCDPKMRDTQQAPGFKWFSFSVPERPTALSPVKPSMGSCDMSMGDATIQVRYSGCRFPARMRWRPVNGGGRIGPYAFRKELDFGEEFRRSCPSNRLAWIEQFDFAVARYG